MSEKEPTIIDIPMEFSYSRTPGNNAENTYEQFSWTRGLMHSLIKDVSFDFGGSCLLDFYKLSEVKKMLKISKIRIHRMKKQSYMRYKNGQWYVAESYTNKLISKYEQKRFEKITDELNKCNYLIEDVCGIIIDYLENDKVEFSFEIYNFY